MVGMAGNDRKELGWNLSDSRKNRICFNRSCEVSVPACCSVVNLILPTAIYNISLSVPFRSRATVFTETALAPFLME
jgi:hypothetical protein